MRLSAATSLLAALLAAPAVVERVEPPQGWFPLAATQSPAPSDFSAEDRRRIRAAVAALEPQRPGVADVYFVGFAGYGDERVFRREAEYARAAFAERFGSGDRSLLLVNDVHDRETYPLATVGGLTYALALLGARMDRDEDVLVLMLTSHGSPDEGLAVENGLRVLDALRPDELGTALAAAGIRWRIVLASACFAGIFIEPLRNDSTLIVTAADAQRSSFGCDDRRELTYFGEAFLRDALPEAGSLEAAYAVARRLIERRERAEGKPHSRPQLHVGEAMRTKLAALEAVRSRT